MNKTVNSESSLSVAIGLLRKTFAEKKYFQIVIKTGKKRTLSQNAASHAWYLKVSREEAEYSAGEVKSLCKFHFGLPILRGEDEEYDRTCSMVIDPLPYESKIKAMEYLPVTSLMNTAQLSEYMEHVQRHYSGRVELVFPNG